MSLTPQTVRVDLKCGKGAISPGEKCHVGPASKVKEVNQATSVNTQKAESKAKKGAEFKKEYVALAAYGALTAAGLYQMKNMRQAYSQKFDPAQRYTPFNGAIGDPVSLLRQMQATDKAAAPSLFGEVSFGKLDGKDIVVKRMGRKGFGGDAQINMMQSQGIISSKTAEALRKAQNSLQTNEVQGAELAGNLGFGPKVVAAGNNTLITETAEGRPLTSQDRLLRNVSRLQQELIADPVRATKKLVALRWRGFTKGTELSSINKNKIIANMAKMHTVGIAHNDLHPGNIFISKKGAQFIDFGTSERGGGAVSAEFVRMMNPPRSGLQQGQGMGYNLRSVDPQGYATAEKQLRQAIGKKVGKLTAADIHKAVERSSNKEALEEKLQGIIDNYYSGYTRRFPHSNTQGAKRRDSFYIKGRASALRFDTPGRACGQSFIAAGKTCRQKGSFPTRKAIAAGLTAGTVGAALLHKGSRKAILKAPANLQRGAQGLITEGVHRITASPPKLKLNPEAFAHIQPPSKTERLHRAAQEANRSAEKAIQKATQIEVERVGVIGEAMYKAGKAARVSLKSGQRRHNLTVERLRRRYEPGYRKTKNSRPNRPTGDNYIPFYAPVALRGIQ